MHLDIGLDQHHGVPVIPEGSEIEDIVATINTEVLGDVLDILEIIAIQWNNTGECINERIERIFERNKESFHEMFPDFFKEDKTAQDFAAYLNENNEELQRVYNFLWNPVKSFGNKYLGTEADELPDFKELGDLVHKIQYFPTRLQGNPRLPERYAKIHSGKVRETYQHPDNPNEMILIATDRISTHDVIHMGTIKGKGKALTKMSNFWFQEFSNNESTKDIPNQLVEVPNFPSDFPEGLKESATIVKKLTALPIEAIVRGYLYGSAQKGYNRDTGKLKTGEHIGRERGTCHKFSEAMFTPSTKSDDGDVNVDFITMIATLTLWLSENGYSNIDAEQLSHQIKDYSCRMYEHANKVSQEKGMILGDTKFEFALDENGTLIVIDEVCTADSSRLWTKDSVIEGKEPESHDKQPTRDEVIDHWKNNPDRNGKYYGEKGFIKYPVPLSNKILEDGEERYENISSTFSEI